MNSSGSVISLMIGLVALMFLFIVSVPYISRQAAPAVTQVGIGGGPETITVDTVDDIANNRAHTSLVGSRVELKDVPVQSVIDAGTFWIGTSPIERVFVLTGKDESMVIGDRRPEPGNRVTVSGIIRAMPSDMDLMLKWKVDHALLPDLRAEAVYIDAENVTLR